MSNEQLLEIEKQLLKLDIHDLQDFILEISAKLYQKKQSKTLPKHIKDGIKESLENYKKGEYVVFGVDEEFSVDMMMKKFKEKFPNKKF